MSAALTGSVPGEQHPPFISAIAYEHPCLDGIAQLDGQDYRDEGLFYPGVFNREENLHAPVKVAGHQVGAADKHFIVSAIPEIIQSGML